MTNATTFSNIVGVRYGVGKQIGEGSFGMVFEGTNLLNQQQVAIKFEPHKSKAPQLRNEYCSYRALVDCPGIPKVYYFGREGMYNILVIDLLGPNLGDLFDHCNRTFTIKTVVMICKQMLSRIQTIHEKNLIHRDIKPENFLFGRQGSINANTIYLVDFGMAKHYLNPKTKQHISYGERKSLTGTARYMSIKTHFGCVQSRRDDLEALGYVLMYFLRGSLPWQGLKTTTNEQRYDKIGKTKLTTTVEHLGSGFPREFTKYLIYVRDLGFEDTPDYDYLRGLLTQALKSVGEVEDSEYDWMTQNDRMCWKVTGINTWAAPQFYHSNVRQHSSTAVVLHDQPSNSHQSIEYRRLIDPVHNPKQTRFVPSISRDKAASSQAQFQRNQTNLDQTQWRATSSQSPDSQQLRRQREPLAEDFIQKLFKILCCSGSRR